MPKFLETMEIFYRGYEFFLKKERSFNFMTIKIAIIQCEALFTALLPISTIYKLFPRLFLIKINLADKLRLPKNFSYRFTENFLELYEIQRIFGISD